MTLSFSLSYSIFNSIVIKISNFTTSMYQLHSPLRLNGNHRPHIQLLSSGRRYSTQQEADLVVIGSGPGGYVAAIKAAQLGMTVNFTGFRILHIRTIKFLIFFVY